MATLLALSLPTLFEAAVVWMTDLGTTTCDVERIISLMKQIEHHVLNPSALKTDYQLQSDIRAYQDRVDETVVSLPQLKERVETLKKRATNPNSYFNTATKAKVGVLASSFEEAADLVLRASFALLIAREKRARSDLDNDEATAFSSIISKVAAARADAARRAEDARIVRKIAEDEAKKAARRKEANKKKKARRKAAAERTVGEGENEGGSESGSESDGSAGGAALPNQVASDPASGLHSGGSVGSEGSVKKPWPLNGHVGCALFAAVYGIAQHEVASSGGLGGEVRAAAAGRGSLPLIRSWIRVDVMKALAGQTRRPPSVPSAVTSWKSASARSSTDAADLGHPPSSAVDVGPFAVVSCLADATTQEIRSASRGGGLYRAPFQKGKRVPTLPRCDLVWFASPTLTRVVVATVPGEAMVLLVPSGSLSACMSSQTTFLLGAGSRKPYGAAPVAMWRGLLQRCVAELVVGSAQSGGVLDNIVFSQEDASNTSSGVDEEDSAGDEDVEVEVASDDGGSPAVAEADDADDDEPIVVASSPRYGNMPDLRGRGAQHLIPQETSAMSEQLVKQYLRTQSKSGTLTTTTMEREDDDEDAVDRGRMLGMYQRLKGTSPQILGIGTFDRRRLVKVLDGTWIVLLVSGGRFSGAVWRNRVCVTHSSFQQYVVRKKQGGRQSAADASSGTKHSAGAGLRRACEGKFRDRIDALFAQWDSLSEAPPTHSQSAASPQTPTPGMQTTFSDDTMQSQSEASGAFAQVPIGTDTETFAAAAVAACSAPPPVSPITTTKGVDEMATFSAWDTAEVIAIWAPGPHNVHDLTFAQRRPDQAKGRPAQYVRLDDPAVMRIPFPVDRPTFAAATATFDMLQSVVVPHNAPQ